VPQLLEHPDSLPGPVTDVIYGITVADPVRWLEDQYSAATRAWIEAQSRYASSYFESIHDQPRIREYVRKLLDVESCDCFHRVRDRYFFRKRLPGEEQPGIYFREGWTGEDQLLFDPATLGGGSHIAVQPLQVSPDGRLLLYEVKDGGERTGRFELLDIKTRRRLPDALPRGYLRGFIFAPDGRGFYYVHEAADAERPNYRAAYHHVLGTSPKKDREIFVAGESPYLRLHLVPGDDRLGFLVYRFLDKTYIDFYLWHLEQNTVTEPLLRDATYKLGPILLSDGRIVAITDYEAPNFRIVQLQARQGRQPEFSDVVPSREYPIRSWLITKTRIFVSYIHGTETRITVFDHVGKNLGALPTDRYESAHLIGSSIEDDEVVFERESFTTPIQTYCYSARTGKAALWAKRPTNLNSDEYRQEQVWFTADDGTRIPMFLVGRRDVLEAGPQPAIMTSYGGYGTPMTPQFSVFVAFLMERGCLFALPNIRGGSEFGSEWHNRAKRTKKQVAIDDFLAASCWLIESGHTRPDRLAIFGGSHAGLLVAAAMAQHPELFRAVVCMAPLLDMLRYHLFDGAHIWKEEFGTADDERDFPSLYSYSPYHRVRDGVSYPATLIVSGDRDHNCNSLHARKMIARLQAANRSGHPVLLDYNPFRGHSPVLPLSDRIDALTNRLAFVCDQLELPV